MEGRMVGKPPKSRSLQMLEEIQENNSYEVLKRTGQQKTEVHGENAQESAKNLKNKKRRNNSIYTRRLKSQTLLEGSLNSRIDLCCSVKL